MLDVVEHHQKLYSEKQSNGRVNRGRMDVKRLKVLLRGKKFV
jgi:hypothetical protein